MLLHVNRIRECSHVHEQISISFLNSKTTNKIEIEIEIYISCDTGIVCKTYTSANDTLNRSSQDKMIKRCDSQKWFQ